MRQMNNIIFRKMNISEIDHVARLDELCIGVTKNFLVYDPIYSGDADAWLLLYKEKLIGYTVYGCPSKWQRDDWFFIYRTGVHPDYRGKGYGRYIRERILKDVRSRGCTLIFSGIKSDNTVMLNLAKSMGFFEWRPNDESYEEKNILLMCWDVGIVTEDLKNENLQI